MVDLATKFDAPTLRSLGKRLFEVVCPEAADAAEGASSPRRRPRHDGLPTSQ
jgi:hypothetical protein